MRCRGVGGLGATEFILSGGALVVPHQMLTVPCISGQPSSAWRCPKPTILALDRYNLGIRAQGNAFLDHAHLACLPPLLSEHRQGCDLLRDMGHSCWSLQPPYLQPFSPGVWGTSSLSSHCAPSSSLGTLCF